MKKRDYERAANIFAQILGVDINEEPELVKIAEEGLRDLPEGCEIEMSEDGIPFYYYSATDESVWDHPYLKRYKKIVESERRNLQQEERQHKGKRKETENKEKRRDQGDSFDDNRGNRNFSKDSDGARGSKSNRKHDFQEHDEVDVVDLDYFDDEIDNKKNKASKDQKNISSGGFVPKNSTNRNKSNSANSGFSMNAADFLLDDGDGDEVKNDDIPENNYNNRNDNKRTNRTKELNVNKYDKYDIASNRDVTTSNTYDDDDDPDDNEYEKERNKRATNKRADNWNQAGIESNKYSNQNDIRSGVGREVDNNDDLLIPNNNNKKKSEWVPKIIHPSNGTTTTTAERDASPSRLQQLRGGQSVGEASKWSAAATTIPGVNNDIISTRNSQIDGPDIELRIGNIKKDYERQLEDLRFQLARSEEKAVREKEDRVATESRLERLKDDYETRIKDNNIKIRADIDEEWKERERLAKNRHQDEIEEFKTQNSTLRRQIDEATREADLARRRVSAGKEEGKAEASNEIIQIRQEMLELEDKYHKQSQELKKVREDHINMAARLASALQTAQVAVAESEAAKAEASSAISEGHTNYSAVLQSTQRIQQLESDNSKLRSENLLLRKEVESQLSELRRVQGTLLSNEDRVGIAESERKRITMQAQSEVSRLTSRVAELEGASNVLREQLDRSADHEEAAVREIQRALEKSDYDASRLRERLAEAEGRLSAELVRVQGLEREITNAQEQLFKRDRVLREERERAENAVGRLEELRSRSEQEASDARSLLQQEKSVAAELIRKHRQEMEKLREEINERLPGIAASAAERVEAACALQSKREIEMVQHQYEGLINKLRRDNAMLQAELSELEAKYRSVSADEKAELERLRYQVKRYQKRSEELEEQLDLMRVDFRKGGYNSGSGGGGGGIGSSNRSNGSTMYTSNNGQKIVVSPQNISSAPSNAQEANNTFMATLIQGQLSLLQQQLNGSLSNISALPYPLLSSSRNNHSQHPSINYDKSFSYSGNTSTPYYYRTDNSKFNSSSIHGAAQVPLSPPPLNSPRKAYDDGGEEEDSPSTLFRSPPSQPQTSFSNSLSQSYNNFVANPVTAASATSHASTTTTTISTLQYQQQQDVSLKKIFESDRYDNNNNKSVHFTDDFGAIFDGGYHQGYWRAKYLKEDLLDDS